MLKTTYLYNKRMIRKSFNVAVTLNYGVNVKICNSEINQKLTAINRSTSELLVPIVAPNVNRTHDQLNNV